MDDKARVQSFDTMSHLPDNKLYMFLVEGLQLLHLDVLQKVAYRHKFCDDVVDLLILESFN